MFVQLFVQLSNLIILQLFLLSGNPGDNGLIVRQRVATDPELGAVVAGNHLLEAMILALATQQRLKTATHPNVPVIFYNNLYGSSLLVLDTIHPFTTMFRD